LGWIEILNAWVAVSCPVIWAAVSGVLRRIVRPFSPQCLETPWDPHPSSQGVSKTNLCVANHPVPNQLETLCDMFRDISSQLGFFRQMTVSSRLLMFAKILGDVLTYHLD
jgi:hypothetical protein